MTARCATVLFGCIACSLVGCAAGLPTYEWRDPDDALAIMSTRDGSVRCVTARFRMFLSKADGRVSLDGALVAEPPHRVRLRAWKLTQAVFDVTVNEEGLFVLDRAHGEPSAAERQGEGSIDAAVLADALSILPGFGGGTAWRVAEAEGARNLTLTKSLGEGTGEIACRVDARTLTRRSCAVRRAGTTLQEIRFGEYRLIGGVAWPYVVRGSGDQGAFEMRFQSVSFDSEIAPGAFRPPRRARRIAGESS